MNLPPPAVQRVEAGVLLQGQALLDCAVLLRVGLRAGYRDSDGNAPPRIKYLAELLATAARDVSDKRHAEVRGDAGLSPSNPSDRISAKEAAEVLNVSPRHVCRLAAELMGRRGPGRAWTFDRGAVHSARAARQGRNAAV